MNTALLKPTMATAHCDVARRVAVLLPLPLSGAYDYLLPEGFALPRGAFVRAPLGKREILGVVWGAGTGDVAPEKLREVVPLEHQPQLPARLCDFIDWLARYTLSPPGAVLALAMRPASAFDPETMRRALIKGDAPPPRLTPARARVLALMQDGLARTPSDIAERANVTASVAKGLGDSGALKWIALPEFVPFPKPDPDFADVTLSPDQARAADELTEAVKHREFAAALLDGVTGSGKTEVYFEAMAEALMQNKQALILMPEIALTGQFLDRFAARFGCRPAEWHSDLSHAREAARLSRRARGRRARRGRRALGAVPALCRSRASSSSMKSTTRPTSRRTASSITPATWRWCARDWRIAPSCSPARRRRWRPMSTPRAAATPG